MDGGGGVVTVAVGGRGVVTVAAGGSGAGWAVVLGLSNGDSCGV